MTINFVCLSPQRWSQLLAGRHPEPAEYHGQIITGEDCWIVLTYLQLTRRGFPVRLSSGWDPDAINVVDGVSLHAAQLPADCFAVTCRGDGHHPALGHLVVVQNRRQVAAERCHFLPLWPQPHLLPRDPSRGDRIETLAFMGAERNLDPSFRAPEFRQALGDRGIVLRINGKPRGGPVSWNDYRDVDLVLAVRNLSVGAATLKPASKLINAWAAGVPALLGPEPAFADLWTDEADFLAVRSPDEVIAAIDRLRASPERYGAMRVRAWQRAEDFTEDRAASEWRAFLQGAAAEAFRDWRRHGPIWRRADYLNRQLQHRMSRWRFRRLIREGGPRILDQEAAATS